MSGQQIGTVVGGVIGLYFGNPQLGMMIGGMIGGAIDPEVIKAPGIGDAQRQTTQAGVPRPVVYGHPAPFMGNIIDGEHKARKITVEEGGKGGPTVEQERFILTSAVRICEGPIAGVVRVKRNGEVVYDVRDEEDIPPWQTGSVFEVLKYMAEIRAKSMAWKRRARFYLGTEDQLPDPALEAIHGAGNTPYYRGTAYMVIEDDDVTDTRGACAQYEFEVVAVGATMPTALTGPGFFAASLQDSSLAYSPFGGAWTEFATDSGTPPSAGENAVWGLNGALFSMASGAYRVTFDHGTQWADVSGIAGVVNSMVYLRPYWMAFTQSDGAFRSTDGLTFAPMALAGSGSSLFGSASRARGDLVLVGQTVGRVCRTSDAGDLWESIPVPLSGGISLVVDTGAHFVIASSEGNQPIAFSDDGAGGTWHTAPYPGQALGVQVLGLAAGLGGEVVAILSNGYSIVSADHGRTWSAGGFAGFLQGGATNVLAYGNHLYVAATNDDSMVLSRYGFAWSVAADFGIEDDTVRSVTYLSCLGTPIPDAPGFFIEPDGTICGPPTDVIKSGSVSLASVIEDVAARCGVPAGRLDVSALGDVIPGFLVANQFTGADTIRPCQQMYFFDMPEIDGALVAVKRGGPSIGVIDDDDLLEVDADQEDVRAQPVEFPLKVSVMTRDPAADYAPNPQTSMRYSAGVKALGEVMIESPIPFGADEAKKRADIIHKVLWAQAEGRSTFPLPEEWTRLVPSDCFERNGKRWMVERVGYADGAVEVEAVYDRASNFGSTARGAPAPPPIPPETGIRGPTILAALNLPPLREQDEAVTGMYLFATGLLRGWAGCTVQMSADGGATFSTVAAVARRSVMGHLSADVDAAGEPISVVLQDGMIYSTTPEEILLGANAFAMVAADGTAEIAQFENATETDVSAFDLTGVVRGVKGTAAAAHSARERFTMLANAVFLPINSSLAGTELMFRGVTNGTVPEDNPIITVVFAPVPVDVVIDGGTI